MSVSSTGAEDEVGVGAMVRRAVGGDVGTLVCVGAGRVGGVAGDLVGALVLFHVTCAVGGDVGTSVSVGGTGRAGVEVG